MVIIATAIWYNANLYLLEYSMYKGKKTHTYYCNLSQSNFQPKVILNLSSTVVRRLDCIWSPFHVFLQDKSGNFWGKAKSISTFGIHRKLICKAVSEQEKGKKQANSNSSLLPAIQSFWKVHHFLTCLSAQIKYQLWLWSQS